MRHEIQYLGGDQSIYHVPRDREARASLVASANYTIVDLTRGESDPDRTVVASTAATVDSATESTTAAAGPGTTDAKAITVASTAGFEVGHVYQIVGGGYSEIFTLDTIVTNASLTATQELRYDYALGATVRGVEIAGTFPSAEAADETDMESGGGPYGVVWDYTIAGRDYAPLEEIYVLRYSTQPVITEVDVLRAWPQANSLARERFTVRDAIAVASEDYHARLEASGRKPELFKHSNVSRVAVRDLAIAYLKRWRKEDDEADRYQERYDRLMNDLTTGQFPERTVKVEQSTNTADRDTERSYGMPRFRIS